jgi:hypothetical protein
MDVLAHPVDKLARVLAAEDGDSEDYESNAGQARDYHRERAERYLEAVNYQGAVGLVEQARGCVTAALNCTAHPWHGDDRARKWLMDADRLGGQ